MAKVPFDAKRMVQLKAQITFELVLMIDIQKIDGQDNPPFRQISADAKFDFSQLPKLAPLVITKKDRNSDKLHKNQKLKQAYEVTGADLIS